jgi:hypothetical protein
MKMSLLLALVATAIAGVAIAKLPPPTEEQKAKAEEAKAKAADAAKKESELLNKWQDITAQKYAAKLKAEGKEFKPTPVAPPAAAPAPQAAAAPKAAAPAGAGASK